MGSGFIGVLMEMKNKINELNVGIQYMIMMERRSLYEKQRKKGAVSE